jgi:hypothetical protein
MSYSWKLVHDTSSRWKPDGLYVEKERDHPTCPLPATPYVCWSEDRALRIAPLKPDTSFECDDPKSPRGRLRIPGRPGPIEAVFATSGLAALGIEFFCRPEAMVWQLDRATQALLPPDTDLVDAHGVITPSGRVAFTKSGAWTAAIDAIFADVARCTSLVIGDPAADVPVPVELTWRPGHASMFFESHGGVGAEVSRASRRDRGRRVGLTTGSLMPVGCQLVAGRGVWKLIAPRQNGNDGGQRFHYLLDGKVAPTIENLAPEGRLSGAVLEAAPKRADVREALGDALQWSALPTRRYAAQEMSGDVVPIEPQGDRDAWEYGPERPVFIGEGGLSLILHHRRPGQRTTPGGPPALKRGTLPVHISAQPSSAYVLFDSLDRQRYGVFAACAEIPKGTWQDASSLSASGLVSWHGLVDRYRVTRLTDNAGAGTLALIFEHGFELAPWFWFAAPFLGVAMVADPNAAWWAATRDPERMSLTRDGDYWRIEDDWCEVLEDDRMGPRELPCRLHAPVRFFWPGLVEGRWSGPILSIEAGASHPRVCGIVADELGEVATIAGSLPIAQTPGERIYRLETSQEVPADWPADIKAAIVAANTPPLKTFGFAGNVRWDRERGALVLQRTLHDRTGIYTMDTAAVHSSRGEA